MKSAGIITIGSELTQGIRTDSNGPAIARRLSRMGYDVRETASVVDRKGPLQEVFEAFIARYDLVVSTGGLGSTSDDVTRESAAAALGKPLHQDPSLLERIRPQVRNLENDPLADSILLQANVIEGATAYPSQSGIAPAQSVPTPRGTLLILPGPPAECMPLLERWAEGVASEEVESIDFSMYGPAETMVQAAVDAILADYEGIGFTVLANPAGVHAVFTDTGAGHDAFAECTARMRAAFGDCVYSESGETLAEVVVGIARDKGKTIACAESCTGGLVAGAITSVPGSSDVFLGGIVSYSNAVKMSHLGVGEDTLAAHGAVSSETASEMCRGAREAIGADLAVATTGIAGPGGGTPDKPVGTVWFGISDADGVYTCMKNRGRGRDSIRRHAVSKALDLLRRRMLGLPLEYTFPADR